MKTYVAKPQTVERDWCVVDATDKTLGRLAAELSPDVAGALAGAERLDAWV